MRKTILPFFVMAMITMCCFGQAPETFKYQAVIRDAGNMIISNQAVGMQLTIRQGNVNGAAVYKETFEVSTNAYGLINLEIGSGNSSDDFKSIDWANGPYFIETAVDSNGGNDFSVMGTGQLLSVPYALYANTAANVTNDKVDDADADPNNEMNTSVVLNGTDLEVTDGKGTIITDLSSLQDGVTDADADPNNEMNMSVVLNETNLEVTDGKGTIITDLSSLQDGVTDADADPNNEMNTSIVLNGTDLEVTDGKGTIITDLSSLQDGVTDADADPNNEMNTSIVLNGTDLEVTDGKGTIITDLSSLQDGVTDADADPNNEMNTSVVLNGTNLEVTDGKGTIITNLASLQDGVTDGDADPNNELQEISRSGTTITLSKGGGSFEDQVGVYTAGTGIDITNNVVSTTSTCGLSIGDTHQGGIIFYLDASGCHGLVSMATDQSAGIQWYNGSDKDTFAYGNGIGAGEGNSQGIRRWQGTCSSCYASELCQDLNSGGYTDWYLPSKYELHLMYQNIGPGNALGLGNVGSFSNSIYWSSTEYSDDRAWWQFFRDGNQGDGLKVNPFNVRAIRSF
ncbi:DUF1566 domain-containing protein [Aquimarina hainanensis]|uniref:DUF1566 domain-containing protein n=1 Tax=Aquimarina hainanensis TaxID=1578017 RepID=A0ABW5N8U4_9FLAO